MAAGEGEGWRSQPRAPGPAGLRRGTYCAEECASCARECVGHERGMRAKRRYGSGEWFATATVRRAKQVIIQKSAWATSGGGAM